jgi:hypothetical protein
MRLEAQGPVGGSEPIAAFGPDGTLIALLTEQGRTARPILVLAPAMTAPGADPC